MMRRNATGAVLVLLVGALARPSQAGPADTPLPTFSDGKPAVKVYTAVGVIKNNGLETDFFCTNLDSAPQDIGVEVFDETGARRNAINAGDGAALSVGPGQTKTISTGHTVEMHEDVPITLDPGTGTGVDNLRNGSGRVVATSKNVSCAAVLVDKFHTICDPNLSCSNSPPTVASLPLLPAP